MLFFFNLPEPAIPHFANWSRRCTERTPRTDYRVADPVRAVHRKSANRQPAIIFAPRHAQPSPNASRRFETAVRRFQRRSTRRCESPVRHRVRFPPLATCSEKLLISRLEVFAGLPEYEPLDCLPASPPPNLDFLVFAHVSSRPKNQRDD
jgi:hypothetical protein